MVGSRLAPTSTRLSARASRRRCRWASRAVRHYPDNFGWFGLTREHSAANLLGRDTQGRIFYRPDITSVTGSQTTNNNPLYFATATEGRTDADRFLGSFNTRWTATDWLTFESQTSHR